MQQGDVVTMPGHPSYNTGRCDHARPSFIQHSALPGYIAGAAFKGRWSRKVIMSELHACLRLLCGVHHGAQHRKSHGPIHGPY
eukprot:1157838-Pelagomonas_calceolata.AAC.3